MARCKNGTRKNKQGECVPYVKRTSPRSRRKRTPSPEWNSDVDKEFDEILKDLRQGKLKKMEMGIGLDCKSCLKKFTTQELQAEIDSRKKIEIPPPQINILVPRKKVKV